MDVGEDGFANRWANVFAYHICLLSSNVVRKLDPDTKECRERIGYGDASWVVSWNCESSSVTRQLHRSAILSQQLPLGFFDERSHQKAIHSEKSAIWTEVEIKIGNNWRAGLILRGQLPLRFEQAQHQILAFFDLGNDEKLFEELFQLLFCEKPRNVA